MSTDNLRVKWIEVEASVWGAQQAELKALREECERFKQGFAKTCEAENVLHEECIALKTQLAELRQGGEAVAYVRADEVILAKHWRGGPAGPDGWEPLCTRPQPAIPPGYVVPDVDWLSNVIRKADGNNLLGAGALAEKIVAALASAPAIQPQAASVSVAEKDVLHGVQTKMLACELLRRIDLATPADSKEVEK